MANKENMKKTEKKEISWDIVYQEKHAEMRWYRDYEQNISSRIITILLGMAAVANTELFKSPISSIILSLVASVFTVVGILSVLHASSRFQQHSEIFYGVLELEVKEYRDAWKKIEDSSGGRKIFMKWARARVLIIVIQTILWVSILGLIWLPKILKI